MSAAAIERVTTNQWESIRQIGERAGVQGMALRWAVSQLNRSGRVDVRTRGGVIQVRRTERP